MSTSTTDRIQKEILLKAPRSRVWKAISDPREFGNWFKVDMSGVTFEAGKPVHAKMTYPGYEGMPFEMVIDRMEPERLFSFRWHPYGIDPNHDYSDEPMTLIEFELEEVEGGTRLTVTESGFDSIPLARRAEAFRENSQGWAEQLRNIEAYVTGAS
ncbi:MAG TPA: SRPBCC family protein [Dehalococcoidia bacterium]|nr:SRPBCC family protein [Dehalococcoidia bacterium]